MGICDERMMNRMADFSDKMKKAWLKSMEAIGNTAGNIASNTRYKVNEMTLLNRRREILSDFGARAYDLWQKGEVFPEELAQQLQELSQVDIQLNALRMERLAGVKTPDEQEKAPEADDSSASANSAVPGPTGCEQNASNEQPGTSPLVDKANQALDTIGSTLKNVGSILGGAINTVTDTLTGKKSTAPDAEQPSTQDPPSPEQATPDSNPEEADQGSESPEQSSKEQDDTSSVADQPAATSETDSENPDEYKVE